MRIEKTILDELINRTPALPPESGGILGGQNGVITHRFPDSGLSRMPAGYAPNAAVLNAAIARWSAEGVALYGIYHSHYPRDRLLSQGDMAYIETLMDSLPPSIRSLYFPIVLPRKEVIAYRADRSGGTLQIVREKIEIYERM